MSFMCDLPTRRQYVNHTDTILAIKCKREKLKKLQINFKRLALLFEAMYVSNLAMIMN